jgi:hypothetical protein
LVIGEHGTSVIVKNLPIEATLFLDEAEPPVLA